VQLCSTACATMSYSLSNCVLRFMEMVGKQFSPFMEMVVQPCLTACLTASYGLWKWLCNYVLQLVQPMSYSLSNCVLRFMEMVGKQFFPFMEIVLEVVRAKISGYIKS
jgi:hypothetical protein